jgi:hypothetical protein
LIVGRCPVLELLLAGCHDTLGLAVDVAAGAIIEEVPAGGVKRAFLPFPATSGRRVVEIVFRKTTSS